jgi:hypothetical protein
MKTKIYILPAVVVLLLSATAFGQKKAAGKTVFTSAYTSFARGCRVTNGQNGSDGFSICRGPGRYQVRVYYSAATTQINAEIRGAEDNFPLATLSLSYEPGKSNIEWRMANGKPFAVILRVPTYEATPPEGEYFGKVNGGELIVKGLKGYGNIDASINTKRSNANAEARAVADKGFSEGGDKAAKITDLQNPR